jgi:hypothetical protein
VVEVVSAPEGRFGDALEAEVLAHAVRERDEPIRRRRAGARALLLSCVSSSSGRSGAKLRINNASTTSTLALPDMAMRRHSAVRPANPGECALGTWCSAAVTTKPCAGTGVDTAKNGGSGSRALILALNPCHASSTVEAR